MLFFTEIFEIFYNFFTTFGLALEKELYTFQGLPTTHMTTTSYTTTAVTSTLVFIVPCQTQDFTIRVVSKGQQYGLDYCLTHDSHDHLVEFYATKWASKEHGVFGQFLSRYNFSTILDSKFAGGLRLWGDDDSTTLTASEMAYIKGVLGHQVSRYCDSTFDRPQK